MKRLGAVAIFGSLFLALLATAGLIFGFIFGGLKYWHFAVAMLLYLKAVLALLLFVRTRSPIDSTAGLLPFEWKMLALGWGVTASLFLVSALIGEGMIGFFGAPIYLILGIIFWSKGVVKKTSMAAH